MIQSEALKILKTGVNVFLTGEPGAGKTHTINEYVEYLRSHGISPAITASTGIAATHIGGMTIHSWSGIGVRKGLNGSDIRHIASIPYVSRRIKRTSVLIIDEVSMLAADMMTMVEAVCREAKGINEPFGGLQVVLVGDFFQLPPIVRKDDENGGQLEGFKSEEGKFAYDSATWQRADFVICYLTEQYRQTDGDELANILKMIRRNEFGDESWNIIRERVIEDKEDREGVTRLFSHNANVDSMNEKMLRGIDGEEMEFEMASYGRQSVIETLKRGCLSPEMLVLKSGAAVMFTKNNPREGFVNGTLGEVLGYDGEYPMVRTKEGREIRVMPMEWAVEDQGKTVARIVQVPLRLAWAITVHKSQGMSLDEAIMDLSRVFEFGQGYVALSRIRKLSGLYLLGWNNRAAEVHPEVIKKDKEFEEKSKKAEMALGRLSEKELIKRQNDFIVANGGTLEEVEDFKGGGERAIKIATERKTLDLLKQGMSLKEIALTRDITLGTVIGHLEKLKEKGEISEAEIERLVSEKVLRALPEIRQAFWECDTDRLAPVREYLGDKYSYEELRMARILIGRENSK